MSVYRRGWNSSAYVSSGTSIPASISSHAQVGDLLLLYVFHRSAITAGVTGWTLVVSQDCDSPTLTGQTLSIYSKTAVSGDIGASFNITTSASGRGASVSHAFYGTDATPSVLDFEVVEDSLKTGYTVNFPVVTADPGQNIVFAATSILASAGFDTTTPAGFEKTSTSVTSDNRLFVGTLLPLSSTTTSGTYTMSDPANTSDNGMVAIALVLTDGAPFDPAETVIVKDVTLGSASTGWSNYSMRQFISKDAFAPTTKSVRVGFQASAAAALNLAEAYLVYSTSGAAIDVASAVPLVFAGETSVVIPAGTEVISDFANLEIDGTKDVIITWRNSGTSSLAHNLNEGSRVATYYRSGNNILQETSTGWTGPYQTQRMTSVSFIESRAEEETLPAVPPAVTQVPILVVGTSVPDVHVTQAVILIVTKEAEPAYITQVPILVPATPRPVPAPRSLVPETPITENWDFLTAVNIGRGGREQRIAMRGTPRMSLSFDVIALDEADRRQLFSILYKYCDEPMTFPLYQYSSIIENNVTAGGLEFLYNLNWTDIRPGDRVAFFSKQTEVVYYATADDYVLEPIYNTAEPPEIIGYTRVGMSIVEPLEVDVSAGWQICPAMDWRLPTVESMRLVQLTAETDLSIESLTPRSLRTDEAADLVTTYDGFMVLDRRPLEEQNLSITRDTFWHDNLTSIPEAVSRWRYPFVGMTRLYRFDRFTDIEYWKDFAERANGRQNPFIVPTFLNDLPLAQVPALGATVLVTSNLYADEEITNLSFRYVRIQRANGTSIFRRILAANVIYDGAGQPLSVAITLNSSIGSTAGVSNNIVSVSYAYLARLDKDQIRLTHESTYTDISFPIRAVVT